MNELMKFLNDNSNRLRFRSLIFRHLFQPIINILTFYAEIYSIIILNSFGVEASQKLSFVL